MDYPQEIYPANGLGESPVEPPRNARIQQMAAKKLLQQ